MKIITKNFIYYILILSIVFGISCTRNVREQTIATDNAKYNLVFAGDTSVYKDNIRQILIDKYKSQANIYVMGNEKLEDLDTSKYDAIIIMNTCIAASPSYNSLNSFIDNHSEKNKIILFVTANSTSWKYSYKSVDAITAASRSGKPELIAQKISGKIDKLIEGKK